MKRPGPPKGRCPKRDEFRSKAVGLKETYSGLGCVKLVLIGKLNISAPTLCEILKEEGLIEPGKKMKLKGKRFRAAEPNAMWQIDHVDLGHGQHMLTVLDDCSGKVLSSNLRKSTELEDVKEILFRCFTEHGNPKAILSDHGTQWYAVCGGKSEFDRMCEEKRIVHIMGRIRHPQTQGKVERFHRSLKDETGINEVADLKEKRRVLDDYVLFYNGVRPHWGIELKVPNDVYYAV